jgi:hypothetical protein
MNYMYLYTNGRHVSNSVKISETVMYVLLLKFKNALALTERIKPNLIARSKVTYGHEQEV